VRDQLRQPPRHSCRVWQFEFLCKFASDGNLCHRPSLTLRLDVPGYFDYTRLSLSVPWLCSTWPHRPAASHVNAYSRQIGEDRLIEWIASNGDLFTDAGAIPSEALPSADADTITPQGRRAWSEVVGRCSKGLQQPFRVRVYQAPVTKARRVREQLAPERKAEPAHEKSTPRAHAVTTARAHDQIPTERRPRHEGAPLPVNQSHHGITQYCLSAWSVRRTEPLTVH
jgi:hypothetical protein